jgi:hypothetical protein
MDVLQGSFKTAFSLHCDQDTYSNALRKGTISRKEDGFETASSVLTQLQVSEFMSQQIK